VEINAILFDEIFSIKDEIERQKIMNERREMAKAHKLTKAFDAMLKAYKKNKRRKESKLVFEYDCCDDEGNPKNLQQNVLKLLEFYDIEVRYNELTKEVDIKINGCEDVTRDNRNEVLKESIYDRCIGHDFKGLSKDRLNSMLLTFADYNKINPVKEYLEKLPVVSGSAELDMLCNTITSNMDKDFKKTLIKTWLISCVAAAYSANGLSAHGVLVLQGRQGKGKTTWFRNLAPNIDWFKDGINLDVKNRDSIVKVVRYWIVELGEIGATVKKDFESLKAFLTQDRDELRRSYAREESFYPRRTIFCGSVNQTEFLNDDTGNRRFWVIPITDINYNHNVDIDKLWAEIVRMYKQGEKWWLDSKEQERLASYNRNHEVLDYTDTLIESGFRWTEVERFWLSAAEIFRRLGSPTNTTLTRISRSLTKRGKKAKQIKGINHFAMPRANDFHNWNYDSAPATWDGD